MSDIKQKAREMFDEFYGKSWKELCEEYGNPPKIELRNYLKSFIDQIIDLAIAEERAKIIKDNLKGERNRVIEMLREDIIAERDKEIVEMIEKALINTDDTNSYSEGIKEGLMHANYLITNTNK